MARKRQRRHHSKAQWRWAFANKKPWARKHARRTKKRTSYKKLPRKKG